MNVAPFADYPGGWWVAGGWAIDLFVGGVPRGHKDLDVAVVRAEQGLVYEHFRGWDLHWVREPGTLAPWDVTSIDAPQHELWLRRSPDAAWELELLLEDVRDGIWSFRRDPRIQRPRAEIGCERDGAPVLAPEIVLLYKSRAPDANDDRDFAHALPTLSSSARRWLCDALAVVHPAHPWRERLA